MPFSLVNSVRNRMTEEVRSRIGQSSARDNLSQAPDHTGRNSDHIHPPSQGTSSNGELSERLTRIEEALELMLIHNRPSSGPNLNLEINSSPDDRGESVMNSPVFGSRDGHIPHQRSPGEERAGGTRLPGRDTASSPSGSQTSVARSVLHGSQLDKLVYKMTNFGERFDKLKEDSSWKNLQTNKYYLEEGRDISRKMEDIQLDNWKLPPSEEEAVIDLFHDLKKMEEQLVLNIGELTEKAEQRKNIKVEIPRFDGSPLMFHAWLREFENITLIIR